MKTTQPVPLHLIPKEIKIYKENIRRKRPPKKINSIYDKKKSEIPFKFIIITFG